MQWHVLISQSPDRTDRLCILIGLGGLIAEPVAVGANKCVEQGKTLTMISLITATKKDNNPSFSKTTLIGELIFEMIDCS